MSPGPIPAPRPGDPGDPAPFGTWFLEFLRRELTPFPGRISLAIRMVLGATLTMLVIMTFHLPAGALGGYFAMILARESLRNSIQQTWLTIAFFGIGTIYVMLGIAMFVDSPLTHFLWVIGSFYLIFFVMGTARNYGLGAGFSFLIATAIPFWDRAGEVNTKVSLTLYTLLSVVVGCGCSLLVEFVYRSFHPEDPVIAGIADRLQIAGEILLAASEGTPPRPAQRARLLQYAMIGPSSLRRQLIRGGISAEMRARVSGAVAVTGRIVELCATALQETQIEGAPPQEDALRMERLGRLLVGQAAAVKSLHDVTEVGLTTFPAHEADQSGSHYLPILPELERSIALLGEIFNLFGLLTEDRSAGSGKEAARSRTQMLALMLGAKPSEIFVADAFTNPDHLVFALRGCLAATICYLIYNGIDWPGINTCVATCIITALGTIGSSRQKQVLRISGAIAGGFLISLPAQVFLLPYMDSITAFTLFFACITGVAAWFATSSPRLSYFGLQIALAFYLVNLQEPMVQISLTVARDRVVGVLLGLTVMWLVFDQIAAPLATVRMGSLMRNNLNMLGDFASTLAELGRIKDDNIEENPAVAHFRQLRDRINDTFSQMNAQADAIVFEFGPRRAQRMRERERMQTMQPAMRSVFLLEIAMLESDQLPGVASGHTVGTALPPVQDFLDCGRHALETIANLPVPGADPDHEGATSTPEEVDAALGSMRHAFSELHTSLGENRGTLLSLCASLISSLTALAQAATTDEDALAA